MELKNYFQILLRKWWIVIPAFLITFTAGVVFTFTTTPTYSATTTYIVAPNSLFEDAKSFMSGLSVLSQQDAIASTFADIASSGKVKGLALKKLSIQSGKDYSIESQLRSGTNIIEITVYGPDPVVTRDLANSVGTIIEDYAQGLYEIYALTQLDEAQIPISPTSPKVINNLLLATIFGLVLGIGLAFLAYYLETPLNEVFSVNIIDGETGIYNKPYFMQRLTEEMVRARRNRYSLSLALMQVDNLNLLKGPSSDKVRGEILRQVARLSGQYLREEDIIAYLSNGTFAFLLPDTSGENAKAIMEYLQTRLIWTSFEETSSGIKFNFGGVVGIVAYNHNGTSRDELMDKAYKALELAEVNEDGKAYLISDSTPLGENNAKDI